MNTDGGPAFPRTGTDTTYSQEGMSLRAWFAGKALVGVLASCGPLKPDPKLSHSDLDNMVAESCVRIADAMLRALERGQEWGQGGEKMPNEELPDEHWHKIQTRPSLSWHPERGWEAACEMRGKMMYGKGRTIAQAQAALRTEWEGGGQ